MAKLQCSVGGFFLLEHPEQLGKVRAGEVPGSIWDFSELRELIEQSSSATWPVHQCFFGAESPKPTRLASNLPEAVRFGQCWHILDSEGSYLGPLGQCPHNHTEPLIGQSTTTWKTTAAAAYPALFCSFLARWCSLQQQFCARLHRAWIRSSATQRRLWLRSSFTQATFLSERTFLRALSCCHGLGHIRPLATWLRVPHSSLGRTGKQGA